MLRIVPHTVPHVGRSYGLFPNGFELHLLTGWEEGGGGGGFKVVNLGFESWGAGFMDWVRLGV